MGSKEKEENRTRGTRYDNYMKPPPDNPEFANFTAAMKHIMTVSKVELKRRHEEWGPTKRKPKASASRVSGARSKRAV
jgi:hypothetical protein